MLDKALEAAKTKKKRGNVQLRHDLNERIDLAIAYVRMEITGPQAQAALGSGSLTTLGTTLLTAIRHGLVEIVDKREKPEPSESI